MKKAVILIFNLYLVSCFPQVDKQKQLKNTVWECQIDSNCINYYKFITDKTYEFYSCEMENISYGEYYFEDDFLMVHQKEIINNEDDLIENRLYKLKVTDKYLEHLSVSDLENGKWVKSDFVFDSSYKYFKKDI